MTRFTQTSPLPLPLHPYYTHLPVAKGGRLGSERRGDGREEVAARGVAPVVEAPGDEDDGVEDGGDAHVGGVLQGGEVLEEGEGEEHEGRDAQDGGLAGGERGGQAGAWVGVGWVCVERSGVRVRVGMCTREKEAQRLIHPPTH